MLKPPLAAKLRRILRVDVRSLAAFVLPFMLYILTLAPTLYNLDSAEFSTAVATGGIVRATGYPLYLLLGRLWSWLPLGDVGYRMNLFSAFTGALTVVLAERVLRRLGVGPWTAFGALGLLATAPFFWALSLIAEVYTLHTALMAAVILLLLRWADDPTPHRLGLAAFVLGLSAGNHAASVLLAPGAIWYALIVAPRRALAPRSVLSVLIGLLAGLAVYLYLPFRYTALPALNYAGHYDAAGTFIPVNLHTLEGLWWLVSGRSFSGQMFAYPGGELWHQAYNFATLLWRAFFAVGIGPGILGAVALLRRDRPLGGMLLLMFASNALFFIDYRVLDKDTMFLPAFLIWALWLGVGYTGLLRWSRRGGDLALPRWGEGLLRGLVVAPVLLAVAWNWRLVDQSDDWSARRRGQTVLDVVEPDALLFGWWDTVPVVQYLQLVEGQRPDVQAINRFLIHPDDMRLLVQRELVRRPIYIDSVPPDLLKLVKAEPVGPVYHLFRRLRPPDHPVRKRGR
jgi:hypothetical protein